MGGTFDHFEARDCSNCSAEPDLVGVGRVLRSARNRDAATDQKSGSPTHRDRVEDKCHCIITHTVPHFPICASNSRHAFSHPHNLPEERERCDEADQKIGGGLCFPAACSRASNAKQVFGNAVPEGLVHTDRGGAFEHAPGSGGPTGCREAYLTVMGDDGFLAGVLILLHTVRRYAYIDRDFVVIVSTAVTQPTIERLQEECVRRSQLCRTRELVSSVEFDLTACKILAAGFDRNELAQQLVAKSARYRSGYWVIKMFVWRLEEYSKLVYIDGDVYFRQSADELFCSPVSPK
eukprot:3100533-Pyramimonas_sp.AAC.1